MVKTLFLLFLFLSPPFKFWQFKAGLSSYFSFSDRLFSPLFSSFLMHKRIFRVINLKTKKKRSLLRLILWWIQVLSCHEKHELRINVRTETSIGMEEEKTRGDLLVLRRKKVKHAQREGDWWMDTQVVHLKPWKGRFGLVYKDLFDFDIPRTKRREKMVPCFEIMFNFVIRLLNRTILGVLGSWTWVLIQSSQSKRVSPCNGSLLPSYKRYCLLLSELWIWDFETIGVPLLWRLSYLTN